MQDFHDRDKFNLLRQAVWSDLHQAEQLLSDDPSLVHAQNGTGETVLHYVAIENGLAEVEWLLVHGADVNSCDDFGETPLMSVASLGHYGICKLLIDNGADITAKDENGESAISHSANNFGNHATCKDCLQLLISHLGNLDINSFFDDLQLDLLSTYAKPEIIDLLALRGLRAKECSHDSNA